MIDDVDVSSARAMRGEEFQGDTMDDEHLGLVLNVLDTDGDGRAEILMMVAGYESLGLELFVYPSEPGRPHVTIATYEDGC